MVRSSRGLRTGTRRKLRKEFGSKFTVTPYLRTFRENDRVVVKQDPSSHKGMPHIRFKGSSGTVMGRRGDSYMVEVRLGDKKKTIMARPEHLKPA
jgi:large subunit ribosomal protein L21e